MHVCSCVCKTSLFRQIAAFLTKPQVKCFKWTLFYKAVRGGGGGGGGGGEGGSPCST